MNILRNFFKSTKSATLQTGAGKAAQGALLIARYSALAEKARKDFNENKYSGHPDEQLELIDSHRATVRELKEAQARGFTINAATVSKAEENLAWWEANTVIPKTDPRYAEGVANYTETIEWAKAGLI